MPCFNAGNLSICMHQQTGHTFSLCITVFIYKGSNNIGQTLSDSLFMHCQKCLIPRQHAKRVMFSDCYGFINNPRKIDAMFQRFICAAGVFGIAVVAMSGYDNEKFTRYLNDSLPQRWSYTPEMSMEPPEVTDAWWQSFGDSLLDTLVSAGINNNYDVAMAMRRVEIARNTMRQARSGWMPEVSASAGWSTSQESGRIAPPYGPQTSTSYFSAGLSASWEIDLFGRIASSVKAKKSGYMASRAEYAGTMVAVSAQIASTYVKLRMLQEQLAVANRHTENQMKIVNIAKARFETTLASKLDVTQALDAYYSTTASIPMLENSIHTTINALAVLTGIPFIEINNLLSVAGNLPEYLQMVNTGVPANLLRRRPDIAQAEMELAGYAAEIGIAKKDFLPTLSIEGNIGTASHEINGMFGRNSMTYSVTPTLSWTIFDGLNRRYELANARETMMAGIDNYNLTVMNAIQETDNAISTYYSNLHYVDAMAKVIEQTEEELRLSVDRYKNSLSPMSDVVTAQMHLLSAENELITAKGGALSALISLYEALGGGFDSDDL